MKKSIMAAVVLLCLCGTAAAQRHIEFLWRGVYFVGDASYGINLNRSADNFSKINDTIASFMPGLTAGYQFRKEAGVGAGFYYLADPTGAFKQLPVFAELRSHFLRSRLTPYTVIQLGYTMPVGTQTTPLRTKINKGGLYAGAELGARYAITRSTALALHVSYRLLQSNEVLRYNEDGNNFLSEAIVNHLVLGGLSFYFGN